MMMDELTHYYPSIINGVYIYCPPLLDILHVVVKMVASVVMVCVVVLSLGIKQACMSW